MIVLLLKLYLPAVVLLAVSFWAAIANGFFEAIPVLIIAHWVFQLYIFKRIVVGQWRGRGKLYALHKALCQIDKNDPDDLTVMTAPDLGKRGGPGVITRTYPPEWLADDPKSEEVSNLISVASARVGRPMFINLNRQKTVYTLYPRVPLGSQDYQHLALRDSAGNIVPHAIPLGLTDPYTRDPASPEGTNVLAWRTRSSSGRDGSPGLLITGTPGAGKSVQLQGIGAYVVGVLHPECGTTFSALEGKGSGTLAWLEGIPGCEGVADTLEELLPWANEMRELVGKRYRERKKVMDDAKRSGIRPEHVMNAMVVIIDEVVQAGEWLRLEFGDKVHGEFMGNLGYVASQGREAGIWIVEATQRPDAKLMTGQHRSQLAARLAMGPHHDDAARMALTNRWAHLGPMIPAKPGRGAYVVGGFSARNQAQLLYSPYDIDIDEYQARKVMELMPDYDDKWQKMADERRAARLRPKEVTEDDRCNDKTKAGTRCKNKVRSNGKCASHLYHKADA